MLARSRSAVRWMTLAVVGLLTFVTVAPVPALAQESLAPGTAATNAAGESVLIRSTPGYDAEAAGELAPGSQVTIADYPVTAADGTVWYPVGGGYVPATALSTEAAVDYAPADQAAGFDGTGAYQAQTYQDPAVYEEPAYDDPAYQEQAYQDPAAQEVAYQDAAYEDPAAYDPAAQDAVYQEPVAEEQAYQEAAYTEPAPAAAPIGTAWVVGTDGGGAICRTAADWSSAELGVLPEGSAVEVTGGVVGEWQQVNCGGVSGYVHAAFISWEEPVAGTATLGGTAPDQTVTATGDTGQQQVSGYRNRNNRRNNNDNNRNGGGNAGSASGQAVADFAMGYVGYPYVYAGAGPHAFDCSGFTMFVVQNTLGMDISHSVPTQYGMGTPVNRNQLQPGDLVFFENTIGPGLTHAGIYIGGGQFVHAENESTGVVVSDLNSDYYSSHYYGAVRLA